MLTSWLPAPSSRLEHYDAFTWTKQTGLCTWTQLWTQLCLIVVCCTCDWRKLVASAYDYICYLLQRQNDAKAVHDLRNKPIKAHWHVVSCECVVVEYNGRWLHKGIFPSLPSGPPPSQAETQKQKNNRRTHINKHTHTHTHTHIVQCPPCGIQSNTTAAALLLWI